MAEKITQGPEGKIIVEVNSKQDNNALCVCNENSAALKCIWRLRKVIEIL